MDLTLIFQVMYVQKIPFPDTPEHLIVLSLSYNKDWVQEESQRIKYVFQICSLSAVLFGAIVVAL